MIETTDNKVVYVVGSDPVFTFPIPFFSAGDIHCYLNDGVGETELVRGIDFVVEVKEDYTSGANVELREIVPGSRLTIMREIPLTQDVNLPEYGKIPSTALETQLDKTIMIAQQMKEELDRSVKVRPTDEMTPEDLMQNLVDVIPAARVATEKAEEAVEAAGQAVEAADRAATSASRADLAANNAEADATSVAADVEEIRELAGEAVMNKVTLAFGDWGDEGIYIAYGDWTPASSLLSIDRKLTAHNTADDAHDNRFNAHNTADDAHDNRFNAHNTASDAHANILDGKAPLASPTFTGTVTVPNQSTSDNSTKAANTKFVHDLVGTGLVPPGTVAAFAGSGSAPLGWLVCNGQAKSWDDPSYRPLYDVIGTTYGVGTEPHTFKVPDFRGMFLRGYLSGTTAAIGTKQGEGLPDITGTLPGENTSQTAYWSEVTGAFYKKTATNNKGGLGSRDGDNTDIQFSASKSNAIYGASNHVTPVNYAIQYIIKHC